MNIKKKINKFKNTYQQYHKILEERKDSKSKNSRQLLLTQYADACQKRISENTVLYESFWGRGFVDNPYAIFLELSGRREFSYLKHIWVIDDFEENQLALEKWQGRRNVLFVKFGTTEYVEFLATAKYLVNNTTFQSYFAKREGQVYINTWHGTPIKAMGYRVPEGSFASANVVRNFLGADYLLAANSHMVKMYLDDYKLEGIYQGEILEEGYPRNDLLYKTPVEDVKNKLAAYGIQLNGGRKTILYAPTWREDCSGSAVVNPGELLDVKERLEAALGEDEYQILIKPHQLVYRQLKDLPEYKGLLVPASMDANELMAVTDILISDYSSIFLDYMVLDRPIFFYIPDLEDYQEGRGLDFSIDELPGPASSELGDIIEGIQKIDDVRKQYQDVYQAVREQMCPYEDGHVSQRVVDAIFGNAAQYRGVRAGKTKETLLLHRGILTENGITHSFLSLLGQLDYGRFDVTVHVIDDPANPTVRKNINHLPSEVRTLVRTGTHVSTVREDTRKNLVTSGFVNRRDMDRLYPTEMAKREFYRCFGDAQFDYIVDFEGYSSLFSMVLTQGSAKVKSIWMHSVIKSDVARMLKKGQKLMNTLKFKKYMYSQYDRLVSCGKSVMEVNREELGASLTGQKFVYARNAVNEKRIEDNLKEPELAQSGSRYYAVQNMESRGENVLCAQFIPIPEDSTVNFVTMGRLSVEKNHISLICAFAQLLEEYPQARLYILGEGALRSKEEDAIHQLGLEGKVMLPGNVQNPFAAMKKCQCFILPSAHEGQPMVLLEARVLHMPILVSDFSSVIDSLLPEGQLLIKATEEGILEGMRTFMRGEVPADYQFDIQEYNREVYEEFVQAIT